MKRNTIARKLRQIVSRWLSLDAPKITFDRVIFKDVSEADANEILVDIYSQFGVCMCIYDLEGISTFKDLVDYIETKIRQDEKE